MSYHLTELVQVVDFPMEDVNFVIIYIYIYILVKHTQYDGCWCPSSMRLQDISIHDIHYIGLVRFLSYVRKDFIYLCHTSVEEWYKLETHVYIAYEKIARKGLKESAP